MKVSTSASIVIPRPRAEVFDFCCRNDFEAPLAYPLALEVMPCFRAWLSQSLESIRDELAG